MQGKTAKLFETWLPRSIRSPHNRIVTLGLLAVGCYLPFWFIQLAVGLTRSTGFIFLAAALVLGLYRLWQQRDTLKKMKASEGDRWLGYFLIITALAVFPFGFSALWIQRIIWIQIFAGIALSSWGLSVFSRYPVSTFLILIGLFPEPTAVGVALWKTFTPPEMLERFTAWIGTMSLRLIGQPATQPTPLSIALPGAAVQIDWGCTGFNMATMLAIASLVVGFAIKESIPNIVLMVVIGIVLAFVANVPRIMLLVISKAYWSEAGFHFWHDSWGTQIISGAMFTVYYYIIMAIRNRRSPRRTTR